jgi:hypothetical protein
MANTTGSAVTYGNRSEKMRREDLGGGADEEELVQDLEDSGVDRVGEQVQEGLGTGRRRSSGGRMRRMWGRARRSRRNAWLAGRRRERRGQNVVGGEIGRRLCKQRWDAVIFSFFRI